MIFFCHLQNISKFSDSLSSPLSLFFSSPQNPFSLSHPHPEYAGEIALPLRWRTALISSEKFKPRYSLFLTPHLSHLTGSVVRRQKVPPRRFRKTGLLPRRKTPKPQGIYSLAPSLFLSPHQLTLLSLARLVGDFTIRVRGLGLG